MIFIFNKVFLKKHINHFGATPPYFTTFDIVGCFNCKQVQFLSTPKLETKQARRSQGLQKLWGKYGRNGKPTIMFVLIDLTLEREWIMSKKH